MSIETYSREIERYGGILTLQAEKIFFNDSLAVMRFISLLEETESDRYRLIFALRGIDILLDDFKLNLPEKQMLLNTIHDSFFREFGGHLELQKVLNAEYRSYKGDIFLHMNYREDVNNGIVEAVEIFTERSKQNVPVIMELFEQTTKEQLLALIPSYIHMFMNRLYIAQHRKYELLVYHFLKKYYSSQLAIEEGQQSKRR
jgi:thiopeptide-type bacteriocin biosynthesis protein